MSITTAVGMGWDINRIGCYFEQLSNANKIDRNIGVVNRNEICQRHIWNAISVIRTIHRFKKKLIHTNNKRIRVCRLITTHTLQIYIHLCCINYDPDFNHNSKYAPVSTTLAYKNNYYAKISVLSENYANISVVSSQR